MQCLIARFVYAHMHIYENFTVGRIIYDGVTVNILSSYTRPDPTYIRPDPTYILLIN